MRFLVGNTFGGYTIKSVNCNEAGKYKEKRLYDIDLELVHSAHHAESTFKRLCKKADRSKYSTYYYNSVTTNFKKWSITHKTPDYTCVHMRIVVAAK
jgi:hypothetical protein